LINIKFFIIDYIKHRVFKIIELCRVYLRETSKITVTFSGVDGAGKTVATILLKHVSRKLGYKPKVLWRRQPYYLTYIVLALTKILSKITGLPKSTIMSRYKILRGFTLVLDVPLYSFVDILKTLNADVAIYDRHLLDVIVDELYVDFSSRSLQHTRLFRKILMSIATRLYRNSINILVTSDIENIKKRRPKENIKELTIKMHIYNKLSKVYDFKVIETQEKFDLKKELEELADVILVSKSYHTFSMLLELASQTLNFSFVKQLKDGLNRRIKTRILWETLKLMPWNLMEAFKLYCYWNMLTVDSYSIQINSAKSVELKAHEIIEHLIKSLNQLDVGGVVCLTGSYIQKSLKPWSDVDIIMITMDKDYTKARNLAEKYREKLPFLSVHVVNLSSFHKLIESDFIEWIRFAGVSECISTLKWRFTYKDKPIRSLCDKRVLLPKNVLHLLKSIE